MTQTLDDLVRLAQETAADLIADVVEPTPYKRRIVFFDGSFLDLYLSQARRGIYAFHYERRHIDETMFRVDNYPHHCAKARATFPHHIHEKRERIIRNSPFGKRPDRILVSLLSFLREQHEASFRKS